MLGDDKSIRQVEGSQATARETAVLLRFVISQQRVPYSNQIASLIKAVKSVGVKLIDANPVELSVGNIVRHILHIIREEDVSLETMGVGGLSVSVGSTQHGNSSALSAAALADTFSTALRAPSLHNLLESIPGPATAPLTGSSGGESEGKSKSVDKNSRSWAEK